MAMVNIVLVGARVTTIIDYYIHLWMFVIQQELVHKRIKSKPLRLNDMNMATHHVKKLN